MPVRNDIIVDFTVSPRIITIAQPSVAIVIQDLYDTLAYIQAIQFNGIYKALILHTQSTGKQPLGVGESLAITLSLNDCKVGFQARSGPTFTECNISGGNLVAADSVGVAMSPINSTAFVQVNYAKSNSATFLQNADISLIKAKTDTVNWQDITDIKDVSLGKWSINKSTNVMTMYKADGVTVLKQFNLNDNASISERVPV